MGLAFKICKRKLTCCYLFFHKDKSCTAEMTKITIPKTRTVGAVTAWQCIFSILQTGANVYGAIPTRIPSNAVSEDKIKFNVFILILFD